MDFEEKVQFLMREFPLLDRMVCETLLKTPEDKLKEYLETQPKLDPPPVNLCLQSVTVE